MRAADAVQTVATNSGGILASTGTSIIFIRCKAPLSFGLLC